MECLNDFEEIVDKATTEEQSLPLLKRIELLDKEIRLLHEFCVKSNFDKKEIEYCAQPLLKEVKEVHSKKWWKTAYFLSIIAALVAFLFVYDPTYRYICVVGKLTSVKILPYWDWTNQFDLECFIDNPYYQHEQLTEEDCDVCKSISGQRLSNVHPDNMAEDFLFNSIPVIVTDVTKNWPIDLKTFNMDTLMKIYIDDQQAEKIDLCIFQSFQSTIFSVKSLFSLYEMKQMNHWQTYWSNCDPSAAKSLRKFYRRPYFLPPMAESSSENWIFTSYSSNAESHKWEVENVNFDGSATWITQIKGRCKVTLSPREPCGKICKDIMAILKAGETLVFTNQLWYFQRLPLGNEESISIASVVSWDELK